MSEQLQEQAQEQPVYSFGQRLQTARRALNMSREEVAAEMRLGVDIVTALEEEDVGKLGAPIFITGYLKKYAGLLKIPLEPLMAAYKQVQVDEPALFSSATQPLRPSHNKLLVRIVSWLIVLAIIAGLVSWVQMQEFTFFNGDTDTASTQDSAPPATLIAPLPEVTDDTGPVDIKTAPAATETDELPSEVLPPAGEVVEPVAPETTSQVVEEVVEQVAQAQAGSEIVLRFSADSWTEVTDKQGEKLVYDLLRRGQVKRLQGEAPFKVFLGNAQAVRIEYNGELYDFSEHVQGNLARFRLGNGENIDG